MRIRVQVGRIGGRSALLAFALAVGMARGASADVIVDQVRRDEIGATLPQPGDVLLRATLPDGSVQPLDDAFDWLETCALASVHGEVHLDLRRGKQVVRLAFDSLGGSLQVHGETTTADSAYLHAAGLRDPLAARTAAERLARKIEAEAREEVRVALALLAVSTAASKDAAEAGIARVLPSVHQPMWRAALREEQARAQLRFGDLDAAAASQQDALAIHAGLAADSTALAVARLGLADIELRRRRYAEADSTLAAAMPGLRAKAPESRAMVRALDLQIRSLVERNQRAAALEPAQEALALLRRLDGDSLEVARHQRSLSSLLRSSGDLQAAKSAADEALRILETLPDAPPLDLVDARLSRGSVAYLLNDTATARSLWTEALASAREHEPGGQRVAEATNNLGVLAQDVGDLDDARHRFHEAMTYFERVSPGGKDVARAESNLGYLELAAGDYLSAEEHFLRAVALQESLNPRGSPMVSALIGAGSARARQGRLETAADSIARAVAILQMPDFTCGFCQVGDWNEIGWFELLRGDPKAAEAQFRRAQETAVATVPEGDAEAWLGLGETALAQAHMGQAREAFTRAAALRARYVPQSAEHARALYGLGRTHAGSDPDRARQLYCDAARVLDLASTRTGGGALSAASFRAQYQDIYAACIDALLRKGEVEAAYLRLIDSRAHGFRLALEKRELQFAMRAPADLAQRLNINTRELADAVAQAGSLAASDERDTARAKLQELGELRARLVDTLRRRAPDVAAFIFPRPAAMPVPPRGSTVISYLVADTHLTIFVAGRHGLRSARVEVGNDALRASVEQFRALIVAHRPAALPALQQAGAALYQQLVEPVAAYIDDGDTLVFSPDGPLHDLPFGALRTPRGRYLVEKHAFTVADSPATLASPSSAPAATGDTLLAVADPAALPAAAVEGADPSRRLAAQLPPLPATRAEVTAIARLFAPAATVLTQQDANEAEVTRRAPQAGVMHFAVHALLDVERPLDSALVLAGSGTSSDGDGLLHVWEILERLHLRANLVVLSGCDTAQGKELRGEGLVGLTRAFQFAGARTVVGSLWSVSDAATATMMERFYTQPRSTRETAMALRVAALEFLRRDQAAPEGARRGVGGLAPSAPRSHPFYWAAFQAYGPPR